MFRFYRFQLKVLLPSCISLFIFGYLVSCSRNEESRIKPDNSNLQNTTASFIYNAIPENAQANISDEYTTALNTFSVNLLDEVYDSDSFHNKNVVLSPFCISRNLAIVTEATTGDSRQELLHVLGGQAALDDARSALSRLLYADNSIILQIADALWIDSTRYSLLPSFRDTANKKYGVEVAGLDFGKLSETVNTINNWIAANTDNRINDAVRESSFTHETALLLTSTIYFEADWTSPFDVSRTEPSPFFTPAGTVNVAMMTSNYQHQCCKTAEYENVRLYYGTDDKDFFYLDVYMPTTITMEKFIADKCLDALESRDSMTFGALCMPKFFFENEVDLKSVLQGMGVYGVFDEDNEEITGMASYKNALDTASLHIEFIVQKAGIKTDEEGTVAYAVTVTGMSDATSAGLDSPDVVLDHPFVYFIRAGETGLVLFTGVVNNPNERS